MNREEFYKAVGIIIQEKRIDKRMTQSQLAKLIGAGTSTIGCYEAGLRCMDLETFFQICNILGIKPNDVQKEIKKG